MTIEITCTSCAKRLRVKDELAGRRGKCPQCGQIVQVPLRRTAERGAAVAPAAVSAAAAAHAASASAAAAPAASAAPAAAAAGAVAAGNGRSYEQRQRDILAAFQGSIEPVRAPWSYRLSILVVALVMVLLPVVYVGLIVLAGYSIYYHAVHHSTMLEAEGGGGRGAFLLLLAYLAPMVCGGILMAFMIKPLFARPAREPRRRSVTRDGEPLLFAFVDRICAAVRAPRPKRIDLDCEVNASASFRRGLLSFLGHDLVLTIGMPLVAGLNVRQFGGILAHEFGHFSQGAGMRLSYLVRSIVHWFHRVVYERDQWDQWLYDTARSIDLRIGWMLYLTMLFVWITRKILFVLMIIGHAVAGFLLRQMEFDADRYEARLAGSETFEATARRLVVLQVASRGAHADLSTFYDEGRLGDNLPKLIEANVGQIPKKLLAEIQKSVDDAKTGLFDTHPSDRDRIANAQREAAAGVFRLELPARTLFRNFDDAARKVTWDFYTGIFGTRLKPQDLHSIEDLLQRQRHEQHAGNALGRFFQGGFQLSRPYALPDLVAVDGPQAKAVARSLRDARQAMLAGLPPYLAHHKTRGEWLRKLVETHQVVQLAEAGVRPSKKDFSCPVDSHKAQKLGRQAAAQLQQIDAELASWDSLAAQRLAAALSLLFCDRLIGKVADMQLHQQRCSSLLPVCRQLLASAPQRYTLQIEYVKLGCLLPYLDTHNEDEMYVRTILKQMENVMIVANDLRDRFRSVPYPLDHAEAGMTIGAYLMKDPLLDKENLGAIYEGTEVLLERLDSLTARLVAQLALAAEGVETALGLPPLPEPPEDADESSG